ncbi:MAG: YihY/virulence factor BrkB family protein [Desemzia incerta]|uniref:Membrane protein n=1 Tax=Desemzia incerta TaxID=82801 RepID=A0A1I5XT31_9LACT|nr:MULTISPECIES: YihY/virulence factor BrkB family protein [Desemzia]MCI3029134.1 YihY/virulence factor BrkB family protein [Desemzia sp. C1]SFQ35088.1 membrane protein [Desemzia incerta]
MEADTVEYLPFKQRMIKLFNIIKDNWSRANVSSQAGELAYFSLLSLFPILLVIANVIPLFPIDVNAVLSYLESAVPPDIFSVIEPILIGYLSSSSGGVISIGLVTALWSASKAFNSLQNILNEVYAVKPRKNFILVRLVSLLVQLAIVSIVGVIIFAFVFGEIIVEFVEGLVNIDLGFIMQILQLRWLILLIVLLALFTAVYFLVPNHHLGIKYAVPGAIFATIGWLALSQGFSIYLQFAGGDAAANATFGVFIILMLWLYLAAMVLLLGGLVNTIYFEYKNGKSVQKAIEQEDEEHSENDKKKKLPKQRKKLVKVKEVKNQ